jgi:hypothetical protein
MKIGDYVVTKLTRQRGRIAHITPLPLSCDGLFRLTIRCVRRTITVDSDMVEIDETRGGMTLQQITEIARRRVQIDCKAYCVIHCPASGYNLMTPERAKKTGRKIIITIYPDTA